jgi:hypothetical protein
MTIKAYTQALLDDGKHIELRHQNNGYWETAWCSSIEELRKQYLQRKDSGNLFTSIHHSPELLSRPIQNSDVDRYTRIFLDLDPVRKKDTPSTASELISARRRSIDVQNYLRAHRWPVPACGLSGNGAHLYYRCAFPVTSELIEMMRLLYDGLARRFSDAKVKLDRAVSNPGRISVLFGSVKRKGTPTSQRPHRRSVVNTPRYWRQLQYFLLERLCNLYSRKDEAKPIEPRARVLVADGNKGDFRTLDSLGWFAAHGSLIRRINPDIYAVKCPWHDEHSTESPKTGGDSVIISRPSRWDIFSCRHDHCQNRRIIDVVNLWGDADAYCSRPYEPRDGRRQALVA